MSRVRLTSNVSRVRLGSSLPIVSTGAFDPGAFDPGAFDTAGAIVVYSGLLFHVRLVGAFMQDRFQIKRNDLLPELLATLLDPDGTAINLTTAVSVRTLIRGPCSSASPTLIVDEDATVVDAATGQVKHVWSGTQTAEEGEYQAEFQITWPGTKLQTVPNDGYFTVEILEDLN